MIKQLRIKNGYRHPNSDFTFSNGQTFIKGKNESGKSTVLEMLMFALWGVKALRTPAAGYDKKLEVVMDFEVNMCDYRVTRTLKDAKLVGLDADNVPRDLAVGTTPVNAKITEIFGYGMGVFTMANACLQGEIEQLSKMKPTERRRLVDQTIGLDVLDSIVEWAGERFTEANSSVKALRSVTVEPARPEIPEGYRSSTIVEAERDLKALSVGEKNTLIGELSAAPDQPVEPVEPFPETVDTINAAIDDRNTIGKHVNDLGTKMDKAAKEIQSLRNNLAQLAAPKLSKEQIAAHRGTNEAHRQWVAKEKLLGRGEHVCPACDHHWPIASDELAQYEGVTETKASPYTDAELVREESYHANAQRRLDLEGQIETTALVLDSTMAEHKEMMPVFQSMQDFSPMLPVRRKYDNDLAAYQHKLHQWNTFNATADAKIKRLEELENVDAELKKLNEEMRASITFEGANNAYEKERKKFESNMELIDEAETRALDYTNVKKSIADAKLVIKQFLLPSLNKVASVLLNQMTGGVRNAIDISEDFEITVDQEPIDGLSGSGKAVSNLAIRIGLGQVLTNKAFSVFLGDELDASMDDDRSSYVAECLKNLTHTIKQVIVVTHKDLKGDHEFDLTPKK